ncbi:hypothetical protein [Actinomycetospora sp.]|uniref:hypothetical protein n=1 Tax=Actinomycetospora sp. TaxID=1872135 RepID=UPI002F42F336
MGRATNVTTVLRSARWVLVVGLLAGALAGLLLDLHLDRSPASSDAQLVLSNGTATPASSEKASTEASYIANQTPTYAALATSDDVLGPAAASVGTTVEALRPEVTVTGLQDTSVLVIEVRADTPSRATAEATALTQTLSGQITRLETPPGQPPRVLVTTSSPASAPAPRYVPPWGLLTVTGALAGLLVVVLGAAVWASGVPQRAGRRFSAWLLRRPTEAELARIPATDPRERRDDPEVAVAKVAGHWLSKLRNRG